MIRYFDILCCLLALLLGIPGAAWAQAADSPVEVEADAIRFDPDTGRYLASGHVHLTWGDMVLEGDEVWWQPTWGHAQATGAVRLTTPDEVMTGSRIWINARDRVGFADNGELTLTGKNIRVQGASLEKLGANSYRVEDGRFTTCDGDPPSWAFGADEVTVTVGGMGQARNVVFYARDLPVLYSPYLSFPVKRERESGFLLPRVGQSSRKGTQFSTAWYQVISDNQDATFYLDALSKLGIGAGLEYRYIFVPDQQGTAKVYSITGIDGQDDQLALDWRHTGHLDPDTWLAVDAEWVSDKEYFDQFGEAASEYTKDKAESVATLTHYRGRWNATGQLHYTKDLDVPSDTTLQRLPDFSLTAVRQPWGQGPLFTLLDSSYTYFYREEGERGHRLRLAPGLALATSLPGALAFDAQATYAQRLYWTEGGAAEGEATQGNWEGSIRLGTTLSRIYTLDGAGAMDRLRHLVTPELALVQVPRVDEDDLPFFDRYDRTDPQSLLVFSLNNLLTARSRQEDGGFAYRDWARLRVSQPYDLREDRERDRWLPLRTELRLQPSAMLAVELDTEVATDELQTETLSLEGQLDDGHGNQLALGYHYDRGVAEYLGAAAATSVLRPIYIDLEERYSIDGSGNLATRARLEYRHQCWSLFLTLTDRTDESAFLLGFALGGLGKVSEFGGTLRDGG